MYINIIATTVIINTIINNANITIITTTTISIIVTGSLPSLALSSYLTIPLSSAFPSFPLHYTPFLLVSLLYLLQLY